MFDIRTSRKYKIIGIVGSRRRNTTEDEQQMRDAFYQIFQSGDRLVSGGCERGGDKFAENLARARGLTITIHYADWDGPKGKFAGFERNTRIAEDCDILIAIVASDRTGGTEDTIIKTHKLGKKVILV